MSVVRPFSRAVARVGPSYRICARSFTSSASPNDEPKRATPFDDLLKNIGQKTEVPRPRTNQFSRPTATRTAGAPLNSQPLSANNRPARKNPFPTLQGLVSESRPRPNDEEQMAAIQETVEFERQMTRKWRDGDVYSPHDLSGVEMSKWSKGQRKGRPKKDVFDMLKINPLNHYWNFSMMSEFMTEMGRIKHSNDTGLRPVNQRKVAKAVRRAIGLGLMPSVHKHPEILQPRSNRLG